MTVLPIGARRRMMRHPRGWIAAGFGVGFSPWAPGTCGSLLAILPWWLWLHDLPLAAYLAVVAVAFLIGIWAARWAIRESGIDDPSVVVWDEVVGMWLALLALPQEWPWVLAAFLLFRLIDVFKPGPVRWADQSIGGGIGTMLDDAVAGLMALVLLQIALLIAG